MTNEEKQEKLSQFFFLLLITRVCQKKKGLSYSHITKQFQLIECAHLLMLNNNSLN